jgi:hypothetical protein
MMTVSELHRKYHKDTGIVFSSMYPGCIAETALFREKRTWFRKVSIIRDYNQDCELFRFLFHFPLG